MNVLPVDIPFARWVGYVFDHPVLKPQWWFRIDDPAHEEEWPDLADPARTLAYLTKLFSAPGFLIQRYSRAQIDQGLNFLVSLSCSSHMVVLSDASLPWSDRQVCIHAMATLYSDLMAPVCGDDLGSLDVDYGPERPTYACYMWWDDIPLYGKMDHPDRNQINEAVLRVFRETLTLKSEACLESVLHGLGHWYSAMPNRTEPLVRQFLRARDDISPELRLYARRAARGAVQ